MTSILVVGSETVLGSNLYATLSAPRTDGAGKPEPTVHALSANSATDAQDILTDGRFDQVIFTGSASRSCWHHRPSPDNRDHETKSLRTWASETAQRAIPFTYFSSDAIFTGPHLFHDEDAPHTCGSPEAEQLRTWEKIVRSSHPEALILRTHVYGWSADGSGTLENWLRALTERNLNDVDGIRHATPILATDIAPIWKRAAAEHLTGTHHLAGAERVNPTRFVRSLAAEFDLPFPLTIRGAELSERPTGFGESETSLQTRKIRKALCVAMPTFAEGLARLREQEETGYRQQLQADLATSEKAAA